MKTQIVTAEERWPELDQAARYVELCTMSLITKEKRRILKTKKGTSCPYPAQCMLELVIKKLEALV